MEYWILQHNRSDIRGDYQPPPGIPPNRGCWRIARFQNRVREDDIAFIWYTNSSSRVRDRGIYNVSTVVCRPNDYAFQTQIERVWGQIRASFTDTEKLQQLERYPAILADDWCYPNDLDPPVLIEELIANGFGDLPIISFSRWGIYSVDRNMGERLLRYIQQTRRITMANTRS